MPDTVNVVVTCTKSKRFPVNADCHLRAVDRGTMAARVRQWQRRLSHAARQRVPVAELYAGDHWSIVRSLHSSRFSIDIWVCSAGYGLVGMNDTITPYSATFSATHADSVSRNVADCAATDTPATWWQHMAEWHPHSSKSPRSLRALAERFPKRAMLVVASETYLRAVAPDLLDARHAMSDPDLLSIVSSGSRALPGLTEHLVPCDARLQTVVNGARRSLNTRIAAKILADSRSLPTLSTLKRRFTRLLNQQPELPRYDRKPLSDPEVCRFIRSRLREDATLRHSPLLRMLRDTGHACEQSRFANLYRQVREQLDVDA